MSSLVGVVTPPTYDYNKDFISSAILSRLNDDSPLVVMETLQLGSEVGTLYFITLYELCIFVFKLLLMYCDDKDRLLKSLMNLLSRKKLTRGSKDWPKFNSLVCHSIIMAQQ